MAFCQQPGVRNHCFDLLQWRYSRPTDESPFESSRLCISRDNKPVVGNSHWTVETSLSFLAYICHRGDSSLLELEKYNLVVIVNSALGITKRALGELLDRAEEYDCKNGSTVISSYGYRLFPHEVLHQTSQFWSDGTYIRYFGPLCSARAVHIFGSGCCVVPASLLTKQIKTEAPTSLVATVIPDYWLSYVWQQEHNVSFWKVTVDYLTEIVEDKYICPADLDIKTALGAMYEYHSFLKWPKGIEFPLPSVQEVSLCRVSKTEQISVWNTGFGGVNMVSDPVELDFEAATAYGVRVVRIGAMVVKGDGRDLDYLVCDNDFVRERELLFENDSAQIDQHIDQLQKSLLRAEAAGLRVIITLTHLPGRCFTDEKDYRFWWNPLYHARLICIWELLAKGLKRQRHILAGYDIINEPFTPSDCTESSVVFSPANEQLNAFYRGVVEAIRKHDKETAIILESTYWSSPKAFPFLDPVDDPLVVYSFHLYDPHVLTSRSKNKERFQYPGEVPQWSGEWGGEKTFWNKEALSNFMQPVVEFQRKYGIDSKRILVGEFGISREIQGSRRYLSDLLAIFAEHGWSWCLFSFRDPEWDSMDYELGEDMLNMLYRQASDLFLTVAQHFY